MVTIKNDKEITTEELISHGFCDKEQIDKIKRAIKKGKNIIITGKIGCGKTTLIRALLQNVDRETDIIVNGCDYNIKRKPKSITKLNVFDLSNRFVEYIDESIKTMIVSKHTIIDICSNGDTKELLDFMLKSYLSSCKRDIEKINSMKECVDMIVVVNRTSEGHRYIKEIIEL